MASQLAPTIAGDSEGAGANWRSMRLTDPTSHDPNAAITGAVVTDWADLSFFTEAVISVENGITTAVIWTPEGSVNGIDWWPLTWRASNAIAFATGARTSPAATDDAVFLDAGGYVRFVRANVGTPNANGTFFTCTGFAY